jgi:SAM-dependent methyltransferase
VKRGSRLAVLDGDHNAYYEQLLLRQMPQRCRRVLDVGCGVGAFAAQLAQRSDQVDALDRSAEMSEEAKRRTPDNVNCILADLIADPLPGKDYDAIFSISALHHMPLQDALPLLAAALRHGGSLLPLPCLDRTWPVSCLSKSSRRPDIACLARCSWRNGCWEATAGSQRTRPARPCPSLWTRR